MITVKEYIENPELLEVYYTPYQQKCLIVDTILSEVVTNESGILLFDYAQLEMLCDNLFISTITNIDMTIEDENNLSPFDQLKSTGEFDELINKISREYNEFNHIVELKLKEIDIQNSVPFMVNSFVNALDSVLSNLNVSELVSKIDNVLKLKEDLGV